ncbi:MAG TPA: 30S ribosomal protein S9 [Thermoguttaceae bacterium]|nr:30S ribosomal protein S9 [Thermoguttaceae bacterium]
MATAATSDILGTGRRKSSVARVRIRPGEGKVTINKRPLDEYFYRDQDRNSVLAPMVHTGTRAEVDVIIRVGGGGTTGQADACKLGIARALKQYKPEYEATLRDSGLLTRDSRMKERKKPGLRAARRATQFSKR